RAGPGGVLVELAAEAVEHDGGGVGGDGGADHDERAAAVDLPGAAGQGAGRVVGVALDGDDAATAVRGDGAVVGDEAARGAAEEAGQPVEEYSRGDGQRGAGVGDDHALPAVVGQGVREIDGPRAAQGLGAGEIEAAVAGLVDQAAVA